MHYSNPSPLVGEGGPKGRMRGTEARGVCECPPHPSHCLRQRAPSLSHRGRGRRSEIDMAKMEALFCVSCGAQLTGPLTIRSSKDPSISKPSLESGLPVMLTGHAYKSWEPITKSVGGMPEIATASMPVPAPLEFVPQFWINPDDLTEAIRPTNKGKRLRGCCG